jgi:hypothetical protein
MFLEELLIFRDEIDDSDGIEFLSHIGLIRLLLNLKKESMNVFILKKNLSEKSKNFY